MAKKFISLVDGAMDDSAKRLSPDAQKAWREANQFYRSYKELFSNDFMHTLDKIAANNPQKVVESIFKRGAAPQIRQVRTMVSPKTFNELKAGYVRRLLETTTDTEGKVVGERVLKQLKDMGEPTLKEFLSPQEIKNLTTFATVGKTLGKKASDSSLLIQLWQGSSIAMMASGGVFDSPKLATGGVAMLVGPVILAKMLTNPTTARYLIEGMTVPAGTKRAAVLSAKIAAAASKYGMEQSMNKGEPIEYQ